MSVEPALTPEEWAFSDPVADDQWENAYGENMGRHAAAALALYGQPFGFTHADVDLLRGNLETCVDERGSLYLADEHESKLQDLADRIAALLPPREGV
jgi:hypothetical protein